MRTGQWKWSRCILIVTLPVISEAQFNSFGQLAHHSPVATHDTQQPEKKHAYFPLHLLTDGAWHGTGAPPLIRYTLNQLLGDRIWVLNYYWLQHLPMQMWRPQWLSSSFLKSSMVWVESEGGVRTDPPRCSLADKRGDLHTALIPSYEGLVSEPCLQGQEKERREREIRARIGKYPHRSSLLKLMIFIIALNPSRIFLSVR